LVKEEGSAALFGGSFDPPHLGHRRIVETLLARPGLQRVFVVPSWLNPFKERSHASPERRLAWCRRVFDLPGVEVLDWEIRQGRPVYTIETWDRLRAEGIPLRYLVIGADNLAGLSRWREFRRLDDEATWLVAAREGAHPDLSPLKRAELLPLELPVSSTMIRQGEGLEYVDPRIRDEVRTLYLREKPDKEPS
jgi:nicotinate-nucleotide adenylyltransferase